MKEKAHESINEKLSALNKTHITCNEGQWIKQQLINKYHILLQHLEENEDVDMDKFCSIIKATHKEVEELICKWESN